MLYEIAIRTGARAGAGTDANVYVTLSGKSGRSERVHLNPKIGGDGFERGATDTVEISAGELGPLTGIEIRRDEAGIWDNWYLEQITVAESKASRGEVWSFPMHNWIAPHRTYELKPNQVVYEVRIETGRVEDAGTDAEVFLRLSGSEGSSDRIRLNPLLSSDAFEYGNTNIVHIVSHDLGELQEIDIGHDNSDRKPGWFLNSIRVTVVADKGQRQWWFPCFTWLAYDGILGKTETTVKASPAAVSEEKKRPVYVMAHMMNTPQLLEEALAVGTNDVECDVMPKTKNGEFEFTVFHGARIDLVRDGVDLKARSVARTPLDEYLEAVKRMAEKYPDFALILFDCKVDDVAPSQLRRCGRAMAEQIRSALYPDLDGRETSAHRLRSVMSVGDESTGEFHDGVNEVHESEGDSTYDSRKYFGRDFSIEELHTAQVNLSRHQDGNNWWGRGFDSQQAYLPFRKYIAKLVAGAKERRAREVIKKIYYWTLDRPESMARVLAAEVDGIIVNDPVRLLNLLRQEEFRHTFRLATRDDNPFERFEGR